MVKLALQIECGGNGRAGFNPPAEGNQWTTGAIGNFRWTDVRLKDVLKKAGVKSTAVYTGHLGADNHLSGDAEKSALSRGVTIEKALAEHNLIAFQQNSEDIHPMNGAPLRLVVPGWPGSCSQKWLTGIKLSAGKWTVDKMAPPSYSATTGNPTSWVIGRQFPEIKGVIHILNASPARAEVVFTIGVSPV